MVGYKGVECQDLEKDEPTIYEKYINKYGVDLQLIITIEEQSELIKALCKVLRYRLVQGKEKQNTICYDNLIKNIYEETSHVNISLEMMRISLNLNEFKIIQLKNERILEMSKYFEQQKLNF